MNFCHLPTSRGGYRYRHAFTLIELLVVITIIAVLAGLLLPVVSKVTQNSYKVQTKAAETQIVAAVKNYQTDYGMYPNPPTVNGIAATAATPQDYTYNTTTGNAALFTVLRALNNETPLTYNTRKVVYFEGSDAKSATAPKAGFVPSPASGNIGNRGSGATGATVNTGDFLDAWGNEYCIRIDCGYSNAVMNPYYGGSEATSDDDASSGYQPLTSTNNVANGSGQTPCLLFGVIVWTHGSDGALGTYGAGTPTVPPSSDDVISWQ